MKAGERLKALIHPGNLLAVCLLGLFVFAAFRLQHSTDVDIFSAEGLKAFVTGLGWRGALYYMAILMITVVVSQLPGVPLAVAAGMIWGPWEAALYSIVGGGSRAASSISTWAEAWGAPFSEQSPAR
jgi:uncharacterized membrane protein YdjX (TVP38/TMEM64 family)